MTNEGIKHDDGKLRFDLIPPRPLLTLAEIYTMGANKYGDRNWEKGLKWGRVFGAVQRHLWAFQNGEDLDPESGLPHLAHAAWGCFTLMEYMQTRKELDDRSHCGEWCDKAGQGVTDTNEGQFSQGKPRPANCPGATNGETRGDSLRLKGLSKAIAGLECAANRWVEQNTEAQEP